jgi:hypothetical protein
MVRYKRKSKAGSDFGSHVDDDLRAVLRNIKNAAIVHGCLAFKRDPRPLMTMPAYFALLPRLRQRSIHPTILTPWRLTFAHCHTSICVQRAERYTREDWCQHCGPRRFDLCTASRIFLPRRANQLFRSFRHPSVQVRRCSATALALTVEPGFLVDVRPE